MVAVEKERKGSLRKECDRIVRGNKKAEKAVVAKIRKLKRLPFEEFKNEVCTRLEDLYGSVNVLGDELCYGFVQDRENLDNLMAVLKKGTDKDQAEFKIIEQNRNTIHEWLADLAEMGFFSAVAIFKLYQKKRRLTGDELKKLATQYHLFMDENSENKAFDFAMDLWEKVSGEQNTGKEVQAHG